MAYKYRNARYINEDGTRIDCELDLPIESGWTPYTLDMSDIDKTIDNDVLYAQMQEAGDIAPYVAPTPPTQEELDAISAEEIRMKRNTLLVTLVDPVVSNPLRWAELTSAQQNEVTQYRLALLNITEQDTFPAFVSWPIIPSILGS